MKRILLQLVFACLAVNSALAQDPVKVAPDAYKTEFENAYVKVQRVHYAAHSKLPEHDHTAFGSAYIYLNDAGPVIFKHVGLSYGAVTRAAVKAGSLRLYKGIKETHEVENPSDTASTFLRVEFKTEPDKNQNTLRGKFFREEAPAGENLAKVQFENEQVRITRLVCATSKPCEVKANATEPVLLVTLTPAQAKAAQTKETWAKLEAGKTRWLAAGKAQQLGTVNNVAAEWLRFDFKTPPLKTTDNNKPHAHPHE
jgi:hypothetical protein